MKKEVASRRGQLLVGFDARVAKATLRLHIAFVPMSQRAPRIFIWTTTKNSELVGVIRDRLDNRADIMSWPGDVISLDPHGVGRLTKTIARCDAAVFVVAPHDIKGWVDYLSAQSNLLILLGIVVAAMPSLRIVLVVPSDRNASSIKLVNAVEYDPKKIKTLVDLASIATKAIRDVLPRETAARQKGAVAKNLGPPSLVFISYSHKDSVWLERLKINLDISDTSVTLSLWDDTRISPGVEWRTAIETALNQATVTVMLVSPAFLASRFIRDIELPTILANVSAGKAMPLWIPITSSRVLETPIAKFQAVVSADKPLDLLPVPKRNKALVEISNKIVATACAR